MPSESLASHEDCSDSFFFGFGLDSLLWGLILLLFEEIEQEMESGGVNGEALMGESEGKEKRVMLFKRIAIFGFDFDFVLVSDSDLFVGLFVGGS